MAIRLLALIPELVFAHLSAGAGSGEHRPVAVGFLELSGDGVTVRRPGDRRRCTAHVVEVNAARAVATGVVPRVSTSPGRFRGKAALVAEPRTARRTAKVMLCAAGRFLTIPALSLRAGASADRILSSGCVAAFRRSYSAAETVNLAARVMGKTLPARSGRASDVTDASRTKFQLRPVPPFSVKGSADQVVVAAIGGVLARQDTTVDRAADRPVGRDRPHRRRDCRTPAPLSRSTFTRSTRLRGQVGPDRPVERPACDVDAQLAANFGCDRLLAPPGEPYSGIPLSPAAAGIVASRRSAAGA